MKKLLYICMPVFVLFLAGGCQNNDVFDRSAATRIQDKLDEIERVLTSSEAGWALDYFVPAEQSIPMVCSFDKDGMTKISRIIGSATEATGRYETVVESAYKVEYGIGPTLSFSTYNELLHVYADPIAPDGTKDGLGHLGDYEFIVTEVYEDHLVLRGKKHGIVSQLWKLDEGTEWKQYIKDNDKMLDLVQDKFIAKWRKKVIKYNGQESVLDYNLIMGYKFPEGISKAHNDFINIVVTDKSIRLQYPLNIDGKEVYEFIYNETADEFEAKNVDAEIVNSDMKLNEQLFHNAHWYIFGEEVCPLYRDMWYEAAKSGFALNVQLSSARVSQGMHAMSVGFFAIFALATGNFYYEFLPIEGTDDEIRLRFMGSMDSGAAYVSSLNDGTFSKIFNIVGGIGSANAITFKITVLEGTEKDPEVLRFTNVANPDHYFNLYPTYKPAFESM